MAWLMDKWQDPYLGCVYLLLLVETKILYFSLPTGTLSSVVKVLFMLWSMLQD